MRLILFSFISICSLTSCHKNNPNINQDGYICPTSLKLTANDTTPTVGDELYISTNDGQSIYNWTGPLNFVVQSQGGADYIEFDNIEINQSGWYDCGVSIPDCYSLFDSIYIDVQYRQGNPPCSLTNNSISGNSVPTLQATSVTEQFDNTWNCISLYASGTYGYPTYTVLFNSYNGTAEPKDGIYTTTNVQSFLPSQDADVIYLQCQYNNYLFQSIANQDVYVSHVNGKLRVAFCGLNFGGDSGNSVIFNATFSGEMTEN
jgi:hypothetical protein